MGDFISGVISQFLSNRRKVLAAFLIGGMLVCLGYLMIGPQTRMPVSVFYAIYLAIGIVGGGGLILAFTITAEHFGKNVRATTAILVPNIARASSILVILVYHVLGKYLGITSSAAVLGTVIYLAAFFALSRLRETHGTDLDFLEASG